MGSQSLVVVIPTRHSPSLWLSLLSVLRQSAQSRKRNWLWPLGMQSCWLVWPLVGAEGQWLSPRLEQMQLLSVADLKTIWSYWGMLMWVI